MQLILSTTFSGLFVKSEPWRKANKLWFEEAAKKLNDSSLIEWADRPDYFKGVDLVMKRLYPELSDSERTVKARELYFNIVCDYISNNDIRNDEVAKYFTRLKQKFKVALVTTNIPEAVEKILLLTGYSEFFDIIESSRPEEKDDKKAVFNRFIEKHGKPLLFIGGDRRDSFDYCIKKGIRCLFANFENKKDIEGVDSVKSLEELDQYLSKL